MSAGYKESSRHFLTSSSDLAVAAIQPGGEEDLAEILQVIGKYKAPFAVGLSLSSSLVHIFDAKKFLLHVGKVRRPLYDPCLLLHKRDPNFYDPL